MRAKRQEGVRDGPGARGWRRGGAFLTPFGKKIQGAPSVCFPSAFVSCHSDTSLLSVVFSSVIQADEQSASHVASSACCKSVRSFFSRVHAGLPVQPRWRGRARWSLVLRGSIKEETRRRDE